MRDKIVAIIVMVILFAVAGYFIRLSGRSREGIANYLMTNYNDYVAKVVEGRLKPFPKYKDCWMPSEWRTWFK